MIFTIPVFISVIAFSIFSYMYFTYKQHRLIVTILLLLLFFIKLTEYTVYGLTLNIQKIPIEFSTMSYFIFSISIIFRIKWLKPFATFAAFISGIGYLLSFIFLGESYFTELPLYEATAAFLNHAILFYTSILVMKYNYFSTKHNLFIYSMTLMFLLYFIIIHNFVTFNNPYIFINMLLQGDILKEITHSNHIPTTVFLIYFGAIIILYRCAISIFHLINKQIYRLEKSTYEHTI